MKKVTGGPAFPFEQRTTSGYVSADGMTLRDYFAAKAMVVYMERPDYRNFNEIAIGAYMMADAMLKERGES